MQVCGRKGCKANHGLCNACSVLKSNGTAFGSSTQVQQFQQVSGWRSRLEAMTSRLEAIAIRLCFKKVARK